MYRTAANQRNDLHRKKKSDRVGLDLKRASLDFEEDRRANGGFSVSRLIADVRPPFEFVEKIERARTAPSMG